MTRFILDSGNPDEYKTIGKLAKDHNNELWGSTTNPSLIAKKLAGQGKKLTTKEAFQLQREIVFEILELVPGAVSAEVYADSQTTSTEMVEQGKEIASWHERVVIKLPTTVEGFKARTELRKLNIVINNTLVFSQQQIYAICLHEHLMQKEFQAKNKWPCFISPFIGRLDDIGESGITLVKNGMELKKSFPEKLWMLAASIRSPRHIQESIDAGSELITVPGKVYQEWFTTGNDPSAFGTNQNPSPSQDNLHKEPLWSPPVNIQCIASVEAFMAALESGELAISHPLTDKGIIKFTEDWQAILQRKN